MRWARENMGLALLAFGLAFALWAAAVWEENPPVERSLTDVPLAFQGLASDHVVFERSAERVRLRLRVPRAMEGTIVPQDVEAFVNVSGLGEGAYERPVQIRVHRRSIQILEVDPPAVRFRLERVESREVPVSIQILGQPAIGYQAGTPLPALPQVRVTGPRSRIAVAAMAVGRIRVEGARQSVETEVALEAVDSEGRVLTEVQVEPARITVTVPIEQRLGFRELPVRVNLRGRPARGYQLTEIAVDPPTVTLTGDPRRLEEVGSYLSTEPIDLSEARGELIAEVPLVLPPGVALVGAPNQVEVRLRVEPILSTQVFQQVPVVVEGLRPGMIARLSPETVDVIVRGPLLYVESLQPDQLRVWVEVRDLERGTYTLTPTVILSATVTNLSWTLIPPSLQVTLMPAPTPTRTR
ncbi:CdaR family protein [Thermoflexus hugenholtzii]|uniref:YbbR domain-containing protein n=1 Tax=Thermoflexus hugenholtzii JAD2 TaxID=877466 RepID=A0A212R6X5_9CHLR|nr:CdaR family protein [Thermoflexus hugenholtzii]SNB67907.1 YbbR domain-containing protein [Thermoflexus hugenholtzii JAD2]